MKCKTTSDCNTAGADKKRRHKKIYGTRIFFIDIYTDFVYYENTKKSITQIQEDTNMTINYSEAEQMIIESEEMANEFATWLKDNREKEAHEWDSDDLGEFFRNKGYETV